jgi:hypothetical protein
LDPKYIRNGSEGCCAAEDLDMDEMQCLEMACAPKGSRVHMIAEGETWVKHHMVKHHMVKHHMVKHGSIMNLWPEY